jgi:hypothetical protein
MTDKERIAALERDLAELKSAVKGEPSGPRPLTKEEQDAFQKEMDELRQRRESFVPPWLIRECAGGVSDADAKGIALRDNRGPTGPSTAGTSGQVTRVSSNPGIPGSGWQAPRPLSILLARTGSMQSLLPTRFASVLS